MNSTARFYSQSISNRVDDLADTVTIGANERTTVKPPESDSANRLVDQMKALIDTVSKKKYIKLGFRRLYSRQLVKQKQKVHLNDTLSVR